MADVRQFRLDENRRMRCKSELPLICKFNFSAVRAPASPPETKAKMVNAEFKQQVLRPAATTSFGKRSRKVLRVQNSLRQRNLQACNSSQTPTPCHGNRTFNRVVEIERQRAQDVEVGTKTGRHDNSLLAGESGTFSPLTMMPLRLAKSFEHPSP